MKPGSPSTRWVVMTIALLLSAVALAGCHDLTNDADPGTEPGDDGADDTDDEAEGETGDESEDETETGSEDETEDESETETETGSEEESESQTEEEDPDPVEEVEAEPDHIVTIEDDVSPICGDDPFEPDSLVIDVGEIVRWDNQGQCPHTATSDDDLWDSGNIDNGDESDFSYKFNEAGTYTYHCAYHSGMTAEIVVNA